jgi:hypothetical protein
LIFAIILTSLSATDLFPKFLYKEYVLKYSLKALPCVLICDLNIPALVDEGVNDNLLLFYLIDFCE